MDSVATRIIFGPLVQLDRMSVFETEGRGFESLRDHQVNATIAQLDRASVYETEGRRFESF